MSNEVEKWVKRSLLLDLAYDEEKDLGDRELVEVSDYLQTNPSDQVRRLPSENADPHEWSDFFFQLKGQRVSYGLASDRELRTYADSPDRGIPEIARKRKPFLDTVQWRCAGAMSQLRERPEPEWASLMALFHTELCATSTPGLMHAMARDLPDLVSGDARTLFTAVAQNNLARALSHERRSAEAIPILDHDVDQWLRDPTAIANMARGAHVDTTLVERLIVFPAVRILATALGDLVRHSEAQLYLVLAGQRAEEVAASGVPYWRTAITLEMALKDLDVRSSDGHCIEPHRPSQPRLLAQYHAWVCLHSEYQCRKGQIDWVKWTNSDSWLVHWHIADANALGEHIERTAQAICEARIRLEKDHRWAADGEDRRSAARRLAAVKATLEMRDGMADAVERLVRGDLNLRPADRCALWGRAASLLRAVRGVIADGGGEDLSNLTDVQALEKWKARLEEVIKSPDLKTYRSAVKYEELLPRNWSRDGCAAFGTREDHTVEAAEATTRTADRCGTHGCAYALLSKYNDIDYFFSAMSTQQAEFTRYLKDPTKDEPSRDFELIGLRRWNSFSPNLASRAASTVGGGYLVRAWISQLQRFYGIAIDPGYNYLENLFSQGFTLPDIDTVVVTHAHPDHTENLTNLLTLLREARQRRAEHRITLIASKGVFARYEHLILAEREYVRDLVVLDPHRGTSSGTRGLTLVGSDGSTRATFALKNRDALLSIKHARAWHADGTDYDSMGIVVAYEPDGSQVVKLGVLSDTRYHPQLSEDFAGCRVVVAHIGSLIDKGQYADFHKCRRDGDRLRWLQHMCNEGGDTGSAGRCFGEPEECCRIRLHAVLGEKNHLYLPGLSLLLCDWERGEKGRGEKGPSLTVLSEFGEELRGGLRVGLARRLSSYWGRAIIPADVGLRVDIATGQVRCTACKRYLKFGAVKARLVTPDEEGIAYVCNTCSRLRGEELHEILRRACSEPQMYRLALDWAVRPAFGS